MYQTTNQTPTKSLSQQPCTAFHTTHTHSPSTVLHCTPHGETNCTTIKDRQRTNKTSTEPQRHTISATPKTQNPRPKTAKPFFCSKSQSQTTAKAPGSVDNTQTNTHYEPTTNDQQPARFTGRTFTILKPARSHREPNTRPSPHPQHTNKLTTNAPRAKPPEAKPNHV